MRKHVLVLTATAVILACGSDAASAQAPGSQMPITEQSSTIEPTPDPVLLQQNQTDRALEQLQDHAEEEEDVLNILD